MADLGRAALFVSLGLAVYATVAGAWAARTHRRRLADSAGNALLAALGSTAVACAVLALRARPSRLLVHVRRAAHVDRAADRLLDLRVLGRPGGIAAALAARARRATRPRQSSSTAAARPTSSRGPCPCSARVSTFFAFMLVAVSSPFGTQTAPLQGAGLNPSLQNPYMLAHPPLLYLGYVGLTVPFAFGMGALLAGPDGRALDRRHPPLDARRVDRARRRAAARRALGVRRGGLGRLLRVGSRRERGADAVARGDRVPALGDDPGEARDAEGLEHAARHPRVLPLALRDVPHALGRRQLDPLVHPEPARAVVPRLHLPRHRGLARARFLAAAAAALEDAARVARLARGGVPLQQPAARRALPDDPLGRRVPDDLGARARRVAHDRAARTTTSSCARSACRCCC